MLQPLFDKRIRPKLDNRLNLEVIQIQSIIVIIVGPIKRRVNQQMLTASKLGFFGL